MKEITVAVIGSGSTYCPELIDGFLKARDSLNLVKVSFMDIDERKRTIVGNLCVRMLKKAGVDCEVVMTDDLDKALQGANFVVTQIRVGKLPARHLDESIPRKYDLIGQETTGIGGCFKALRTIPVIKHICDRIEAICPDAWLINCTKKWKLEFTYNHSSYSTPPPVNLIDINIDGSQKLKGNTNQESYCVIASIAIYRYSGKNGLEISDSSAQSTRYSDNNGDLGKISAWDL